MGVMVGDVLLLHGKQKVCSGHLFSKCSCIHYHVLSIVHPFKIFLLICMTISPAFMYVYHVCACQGQKRVPDPLELEVQLVVSCHVGTGN